MTQGERVREIRKALGLTLDEFGKTVGVTKQTISRIENGINNLTDQMAKSICREFNVSYDYLIYGDGDMFDSLPQTILDELCQQYNLDDLDRKILDLYISFPKELRDKIKITFGSISRKTDPQTQKGGNQSITLWLPPFIFPYVGIQTV